MTSRNQIRLSVALVAAAILVVAAFTRFGRSSDPQGGAQAGHDHAAMSAAAGETRAPVRLESDAARRIGVTYATVTRKPFTRSISAPGNVMFDETRLVTVNPRIEGWIEKLYVDFTGAPVRRGQPLLEVYSPMLVSAQEELLLARRLVDAASAGGDRATANARDLLEAARHRLRAWQIPEATIRRIEESGTAQRTVVLVAPANGIVVEKMAIEGTRVMPGMDLFRIADLSRVWIEGDVFEKDLALVRVGQVARVSFEAYPGETFAGTVTYVYPTVSVEARTGRIRIELANPDLRFKPGMYAKVTLAVQGRESLMIPRSAVHFTGERALVFVRGLDGALEPREITTGHASDDEIEVLNGLAENDVIVTSANFLIDAEANMRSAMQPMTRGDSAGAQPHAPAATPAGHMGH